MTTEHRSGLTVSLIYLSLEPLAWAGSGRN